MMLTGMTTNPFFSRISIAQRINRLCGGVVIAPWDVGCLPDDWLDAFRVLAGQGQVYEQARATVERSKADWLKRFKHYRN
jgi:hypothetical protein